MPCIYQLYPPLELRPKGRGRPQRILLGNWPEEHVRQVIRAVVFRDGTIPSYGNNDVNPSDMLPPPSRCDSRGSNEPSSSAHHLSSPSCEKKPRIDLGLGLSNKSERLLSSKLFSRGHSRSVSPPSNLNRHLQNGCYSPENNIPGNNMMSPLEGFSLATHIQQMYRQQLAAASQIFAANKMAANAAIENNEDSRDLNSNAFAAAAMSNLLALDPAFKAFLNENEDREEKFADADDSPNDLNEENCSFEDDVGNIEGANAKENQNGGVSPPRIRIGKSSFFNKSFSAEEPDNPEDAITREKSNDEEKPNKENVGPHSLGESIWRHDCSEQVSPPIITVKQNRSDENEDVASSRKDEPHLNDIINESSMDSFHKIKSLNRPSLFCNEKPRKNGISENPKDSLSLPMKCTEEPNYSEEFPNFSETLSISPIPGTSRCSNSMTSFLTETKETSGSEENLENENEIRITGRNNSYGENPESNQPANYQEVK